jgi:hypothetical protein
VHDRASRGPGRAVRAARQSTTRDLVVGRAGLDAAANASQHPMRLPTAAQGAGSLTSEMAEGPRQLA